MSFPGRGGGANSKGHRNPEAGSRQPCSPSTRHQGRRLGTRINAGPENTQHVAAHIQKQGKGGRHASRGVTWPRGGPSPQAVRHRSERSSPCGVQVHGNASSGQARAAHASSRRPSERPMPSTRSSQAASPSTPLPQPRPAEGTTNPATPNRGSLPRLITWFAEGSGSTPPAERRRRTGAAPRWPRPPTRRSRRRPG